MCKSLKTKFFNERHKQIIKQKMIALPTENPINLMNVFHDSMVSVFSKGVRCVNLSIVNTTTSLLLGWLYLFLPLSTPSPPPLLSTPHKSHCKRKAQVTFGLYLVFIQPFRKSLNRQSRADLIRQQQLNFTLE